MAQTSSLYTLTNRQKDLCGYAGAFGILICLTVIVQHLMITRSHWLAYTLFAYYLFACFCFLMLALQKMVAPVLLIVSAVLSLIAVVVLLKAGLFSLIVLLLLFYHVIIIVFLYVNEVPAGLRMKEAALRKEREEWEGKF